MPSHHDLDAQLQGCRCIDRPKLIAQLTKIQRRQQQGKPVDRLMDAFTKALTNSQAVVTAKRAQLPVITFPDDLPIAQRQREIKQAISEHQVVVLAGETGSGKTTQLPKICLELGRGTEGLIGHTQPRRIAARTVASRIADELKVAVGEQVGYQVRFNEQLSDSTYLKLMTDGVLLAEIQTDPLLLRYDTLIIDEAHERSLNIDFLLGYLKQLLPKRPDLKLIITSATIDVEKFSEHFTNAPVIEVSGRTFPVEVVYRPINQDNDQPQTQTEKIIEVLEDIQTLPKRGDILIFLSGEREIRETSKAIRDAQFRHLSVVPLYARLSLAEQNKVFQPHKGVRVVLATNVAETSLTVPGIRYVIDPGTARVSRYSYRSKVQRLPIEAISQASANQRKGRCGRVSEGVCFRLYSEEDFATRPPFTDPEIVRTNLAAVILQMLRLRIGDIRDFPFVDAPDSRLINDGFNLLRELRAINGRGELTKLGNQLAAIPIDPRLGAMLLAASQTGALQEVLKIVAVLSIQDPRDRPSDKQQTADEKHRQWQDNDSDFITLLNIWNHFEQQRQELSRNQFEKYCRRHFISPLRMREWRDMHHQLHRFCRQQSLTENTQPSNYDAIHKALLTGLLGNIGYRHEAKEYLGARNRRFNIFPGSGLFKAVPKWIIVSELIETTRLFAHTNAKINPDWIAGLASHLVKKTYSEPHYDARSGQVIAYQKQTLYGLVVVEMRRCSYSKIDPQLSRELFIRGALVEGLYRGKGRFFKHNQQVIKSIQEMEAKTRRRDILADDQVLYQFYDQRVPEQIVNLAGFEHWLKKDQQQNPERLFISPEQLIQNSGGLAEHSQFPNVISWQGVDYRLEYRFQPGEQGDGVSVIIPLSILHQVPRYLFDWLVPGLLTEKCIALIKGLPKSLRRHFVPVPDYAAKALQAMQVADNALTESLAHQLKRLTGVTIAEQDWRHEHLDAYYKMNFRLVDERHKLIAESRDLAKLKQTYRQQFQAASKQPSQVDDGPLSDWTFDTLPESWIVKNDGLTIKSYPALVTSDKGIFRRLLDNPYAAENHTRQALVDLYMQVHPQPAKYLRKQLFKGADLTLVGAGLTDKANLIEDLITASYQNALVANQAIPRSRDDFYVHLESGKSNLIPLANNYEKLLMDCLVQLVTIRQQITQRRSGFTATVADIEQQLEQLFAKGFLQSASVEWINQYSRYGKAISARLDRVPAQQDKDLVLVDYMETARQTLEVFKQGWLDKSQTLQEEIIKYRFMLEEYRVSVFAQQLNTLVPISEQRLAKQVLKIEQLTKQHQL